ncbi:unnamed protein product [Cylicocyclus nassatus]|uniref:Cationic amino acid transporter C-terminal domain-containing protein n=1 Tax=Cylicocyclus nassatus TaxID=53992 RepID=A0AA36MD85_CYLNA|nr:unnamed protein product [Cylicocyclus nassatus]
MGTKALLSQILRKRTYDASSVLDSKLHRCMSVLDVMFLAIGQMIGAGIYVLVGALVHSQTGPSVIISYTFAGFAALMSAFSYAEFGARYPRAGSAYSYAYVGIGEIWAFIIGWNLILEYMIGNAALARSWSGYLDNLVDHSISNFTMNTIGTLGTRNGFFSQYLDLVSFLLIIAAAFVVAVGTKPFSTVNTIFVFINVSIILFITIYGFSYANLSYWVGNDKQGRSKFFPFGFSGTLSGAATCFFSFIGFEALATTGEEAKNPRKTIPIATFGSLSAVTFLYVAMSSSLTLMTPWNNVDPAAPFAAAFEEKGAHVAKYIITIGALAAMLNNLASSAFALPRCVYAMADDGLLFLWLGKVNKHTKVPLNAIIVFATLNAILAVVFDLEALVEFLSIGTFLAYSIVSASVLLMRYQPAPISDDSDKWDEGGTFKRWVPMRNYLEKLPTGKTIYVAVPTLVLSYFWLAFSMRFELYSMGLGYISIALSVLFIIVTLVFIYGHNQNSLDLSYKVPFVPLIPALSLLINCFMMAYLTYLTWIRFFIWIGAGLVIYFLYGVRHSKEGKRRRTVADTGLPQLRMADHRASEKQIHF